MNYVHTHIHKQRFKTILCDLPLKNRMWWLFNERD